MDLILLFLIPIILIIGSTGGIILLVKSMRQKPRARLSPTEELRAQRIWAKREIWGDEICQLVIDRQVRKNMTKEMVEDAWGPPTNIDQERETLKFTEERWVYGYPRREPVNYVKFRNDQVIETIKNFQPRPQYLSPGCVARLKPVVKVCLISILILIALASSFWFVFAIFTLVPLIFQQGMPY